jgi:hypothetical protein
MSLDFDSYFPSIEGQLKLAAFGCGYRIVDWLDDGTVPVVEGLADQPAPWQPHLDDGDSRKLQVAMEIHITFGMVRNVSVVSPGSAVLQQAYLPTDSLRGRYH